MNQIKIGTIISAKTAEKQIPVLADLGFESVSLTFGDSVGDDVDLEKLAETLFTLTKKHNMIISSVSIFGRHSFGEESQGIRRDWERLIDTAHLFGTDLVTGFTGRIEGQRADESLRPFTDMFTPLCDRAKEKNVRIAFENCRMGGNFWSGAYNIAISQSMWEMIFEVLPHDNVGLQWEPCHQLTQLADPIPQLRRWAKKIFNVHGKDATVAWDIIRDQGIDSGYLYVWDRTPGFGDSNWTDIISILRMNGYEGTIDIEGHHDPVYRDDYEYTAQIHALKYLKECRGGDFVDMKWPY